MGGCGRSEGESNPDKADGMSGHQQSTEFKVHVKWRIACGSPKMHAKQ